MSSDRFQNGTLCAAFCGAVAGLGGLAAIGIGCLFAPAIVPAAAAVVIGGGVLEGGAIVAGIAGIALS